MLNDHPRVKPVGCSLNIADFNAFTWGERQYLTGGMWSRPKGRFVTAGAPTSIYHLPVYGLIGDAISHARPDDCKVHIVLDEQRLMQEGVLQTIKAARKEKLLEDPSSRKLGDVSFGCSQAHEGIQAADLLAYLWHRNYSVKLKGHRLQATLAILGERWHLGVLTTPKLEYILAKLPSEQRAKVRAVKSPAEIQRSKSKAR
ncbi:MAG TPA: hypothetical protein VIP09_13865 [Dehalococcoidia bacterium]